MSRDCFCKTTIPGSLGVVSTVLLLPTSPALEKHGLFDQIYGLKRPIKQLLPHASNRMGPLRQHFIDCELPTKIATTNSSTGILAGTIFWSAFAGCDRVREQG